MSRVVVDSSLAIKWIFVEDWSAEAISQLRDWIDQGTERIVPSWFMCELANVMFQRVRDRLLSLREAQDNLRDIVRFVHILDAEPAVSVRALKVARDLAQRASYDAHYVALADQIGCELWTADARFWNAASPTFPFVKWLGT